MGYVHSPTFRQGKIILQIGHIRPLCAFAGKAARERPDITITLMFAGGYDDRIQGEISRYVPENDTDFQAKIR
jgi:hypothetical protein